MNTPREALEAAIILQRQSASALRRAGLKSMAADCEAVAEEAQETLKSMDNAERLARLESKEIH